MMRFLLDTDIFSDFLQNHPTVIATVVRHLNSHVAISIISVEEIWDGWKAALRKAKSHDDTGLAYDRLTATLTELKDWTVVSYDILSVARYESLKKLKLNVGTSDLKIAAIALETNATVVTRNVRDFARIPGLQIEDWSRSANS